MIINKLMRIKIVFLFLIATLSVQGQVQSEKIITLSKEINIYDVSNDGSRIVAAMNKQIEAWDTHNSNQIITFSHQHSATIQDIDLSIDGNLALSGDYNGNVFLWNAKEGERLSTFSVGNELELYPSIQSVAFSSDGKYFATAKSSFQPNLQIWDTETQEELMQMVANSRVNRLDFTENNEYLFANTSAGGTLFSLKNGEVLQEYTGAGGTLSEDNEHVYILTGREPKMLVVEKWNIISNEIVTTSDKFQIVGITGNVTHISNDGRYLLIISERDQQTILYDVQKNSVVRTFVNDDTKVFHATQFLPGGKSVAGFAGNKIYTWDISDLTSSVSNPLNFDN